MLVLQCSLELDSVLALKVLPAVDLVGVEPVGEAVAAEVVLPGDEDKREGWTWK